MSNQIQMAQLCVTRWWSCVLGQCRTAMVGTWRYWVTMKRLLMLLGQYRASMPSYIEISEDLVCVTNPSWTHRQTLKERATMRVELSKRKCIFTKMVIYDVSVGSGNRQHGKSLRLHPQQSSLYTVCQYRGIQTYIVGIETPLWHQASTSSLTYSNCELT